MILCTHPRISYWKTHIRTARLFMKRGTENASPLEEEMQMGLRQMDIQIQS